MNYMAFKTWQPFNSIYPALAVAYFSSASIRTIWKYWRVTMLQENSKTPITVATARLFSRFHWWIDYFYRTVATRKKVSYLSANLLRWKSYCYYYSCFCLFCPPPRSGDSTIIKTLSETVLPMKKHSTILKKRITIASGSGQRPGLTVQNIT